MKRLIACSLVVLGFASVALSEELVREISWAELDKAGQLLGGEVQPDGTLKIANPDTQPKTVAITELKNPGVTALRYAVEGEVRYEEVETQSALEMWNYFPNGGSYFSRTLAEVGPLKSIEGTSDWRTFCLPFFSQEGTGPPDRLKLNLMFGGRGTVYLEPVRLVQYTEGEDPLAMASGSQTSADAWWNDRTGGLIGGIGGSILGCLGALMGILGGAGRARRFVMALAVCVTMFGVAALGLGIAALGLGQPYAVYYPLLLGGGISTVVFGGLLPVIRQRYQQAELRRMTAMDVGAAASKGPEPSALVNRRP
ncbi:MAG: hypothetical protein ABIP48_05900 [Planctomycetota bacterium]